MIFVIDEKEYRPDVAHTLPRAYCITSSKWLKHVDEIRTWVKADWIKNWCTIPLLEYSPWQDAVETFAVLGIALVVDFFNADLPETYNAISEILENF